MVQREISTVTHRAHTVDVVPNTGTVLWIAQRLTSYGLILFLGVHLYFTYFARLDTKSPLTFELFKRPFDVYPFIYAVNEALLLVSALFHGLNGLRNIIFDWTINPNVRRVISIILLVVGIGFTVYGGIILAQFV